MNVAKGIKSEIVMKGMVQKAVAEKAGFTEQQLSDMLCGRKVIKAEYLPPIAAALGVGINDLFEAGRDAG